jgi:hypothetical protein
MRRIVAVIALALFATPATAAPKDTEYNVTILGVGRLSCATWKADYASQGASWILGYWTGMNFMNAAHHQVGGSVGSVGILDAVTRFCAAKPSTVMMQAINTVYRDFEKSGR